MKKLLFILAALSFALCSCSPRVASSLPSETIPEEHPDYAVIHFYRTRNFVKTPYDVYLGDQAVYRSKDRSKAVVKVDKPGKYEVWAKTETRESIVLDIEPGKDYYVKTYVGMGVVIYRPLLMPVPRETALAEMRAIR